MKKIVSGCLAALFLVLTLSSVTVSAVSFTPPFDPNADEVYLVNLDTSEIVYQKNADTPRSPASLTKLMTALLLMENVPDLDNTVITAPGYVYDELYNAGGSTADVRPYEQITAKNLLYGMMLPSGNECASIVADYVGGGNLSNFFYLMNTRAQALGCTNTNFACAHGLYTKDEGNYSTAHDMYLIAKACYDKGSLFMDVVNTYSWTMPASNKHASEYTILNTNALINKSSVWYRSYVQGIKTGSMPDAGYNLISTATKNGMTYMLVVMGTPYEKDENGYGLAFSVSCQIYDWVFSSLSLQNALDTTQDAAEVKLNYCADQDTVKVRPTDSFKTLLPIEGDSTTVTKVYHLPDSVDAPVTAGEVLGSVTLYLSGEELGTVELAASTGAARDRTLYTVARIQAFFSSLYFRVLMILVVITLAAYFIYLAAAARRSRKERRIGRGR